MIHRPIVIATLLLGKAASAAEVGHCRSNEQAFFSCQLHSGKVVSVCGSKKLTASFGYLQYRFGRLGHLELEFPATTANTLRQFSFESHQPYQGESELLSFTIGKHQYSVYRAMGTDPKPFQDAGVLISQSSEMGGSRFVNLKCLPKRIERLSALHDLVPEVK